MKPHHRAFIVAGLIAGLPVLAQGASQPSTAQPPQGTASQQGTECTCPMMMGHGEGMHGQGMQGHMGANCPMTGMANVAVEQTPTGAVLRFTAKDPAKVAEVQRMAQMMEHCMGGACATK